MFIYGSWIELFRMTTNTMSSVAHSEMQTKYLIKPYHVGGLLAVIGVYFGAKYCNHHHYIIPAILMVSGFITMLIMHLDMKKNL